MKPKAIFLIVWKSWKNYKIHLFHRTMDAWQFIHANNVNSYSVYWATKEIDHSNSTEKVKQLITQLIKENPEIKTWLESEAKER